MSGQGEQLQPLCVFGCGRMVMLAGRACWPCQSYEEYCFQPHCDCPHNLFEDCRCDNECEEDCPALEDYYERLVNAVRNELQDGG